MKTFRDALVYMIEKEPYISGKARGTAQSALSDPPSPPESVSSVSSVSSSPFVSTPKPTRSVKVATPAPFLSMSRSSSPVKGNRDESDDWKIVGHPSTDAPRKTSALADTLVTAPKRLSRSVSPSKHHVRFHDIPLSAHENEDSEGDLSDTPPVSGVSRAESTHLSMPSTPSASSIHLRSEAISSSSGSSRTTGNVRSPVSLPKPALHALRKSSLILCS